MTPTLIIVDAPHMYAAAVVGRRGKIERAAPIMAWSIGRPWEYLTRWAYRKGYTVIRFDG